MICRCLVDLKFKVLDVLVARGTMFLNFVWVRDLFGGKEKEVVKVTKKHSQTGQILEKVWTLLRQGLAMSGMVSVNG